MTPYAATLLAAAFTLALVGSAGGQTVAPHAVGLRLDNPIDVRFDAGQGFRYLGRPALSYRLGLTESSALEGAVGYRRDGGGGITFRTLAFDLSYQRFLSLGLAGGEEAAPALRGYYGVGLGIANHR